MRVLTTGVRPIVHWLVVGVLVLGILHLALHMAQGWLENRFGLVITRWFDMNAEASISTWYNVGLLQLVAGLAVVAAVAEADRRRRLAWSALAAAVFLLSLDEKISIHESLPDLLGMNRGEMPTHEWLLPGLAIAFMALGVLVFLLRPLPKVVIVGLWWSLLVYGSGAVGVEAVSGIFVRFLEIDHPLRLLMPVWELIEESLEMLGCILALAVVLTHLERAGVYDPARWRRAPDYDAPSSRAV